jgi:hypothetical protein
MSHESLSNHIANLAAKHKDIDNQLNELYKHSSVSSTIITELKKQKLELKDQITRLQKGDVNG